MTESTKPEPKCNRCGACCHFIDEQGKKRACKNLVQISPDKFHCRIYAQKNRVGSVIYKKGNFVVKCNLIENVKLNFNGCPYNKPGQPDAPEILQPKL